MTVRNCAECGCALPEFYTSAICSFCLWGPEEEVATVAGAPLLAGHRIEKEIARGGMGIVYEATDEAAGRVVALKMLLPHLADRAGMRERFRLEARSVATLDHPGILSVYEVGDTSDSPYFTMKLARGGSLAERKEQFRGVWRGIAELIAQLAGALHYAHSHGILHRDIKPANILFDEDEHPYLTDFGLAKLIDSDSELTQTAAFLGTPHYLAPEVASSSASSATVASDLWGLGTVFYELLAGQHPFEAESIPALLTAVVKDEPAPFKGDPIIPRDLQVICLKCLAKNPKSRYDSAVALAEDLNAWLDGRPIKARPTHVAERLWLRAKRNPVLSAMAIALVMALLSLGLSVIQESRANTRALAESLLHEARLERQTGQFDRREAALKAIERAIAIKRSPETRDELISILAWPELSFLQEITAPLPAIAVSEDITRYAIMESDGISIYRLDGGPRERVLPLDPDAYHIVGPFTPDGQHLIVRLTKRMEFWNIEKSEKVLVLPGSWYSLTYSKDRSQMAVALSMGNMHTFALDRPTIEARDLGALAYRLVPKAYSPDNTTIAAKREFTSQNELLLVDSKTGVPVRDVEVPKAGNAQRAVYADDGDSLFAAFVSGNIHRFALKEHSPSTVLAGHSDSVTNLALLDRGRYLISQAKDDTTRFWDTTTGKTLATLPWSGRHFGTNITLGNRFVVRRGEELVVGELTPSAVCVSIALPDPDPDFKSASGRWELSFAPDGRSLAASAQQNVHLIDSTSESVSKSYPVVAVHGFSFSSQSDTFYAGRNTSVFQYHISPSGVCEERLLHLRLEGGRYHPARHVAWTGDDYGLAVAWDGRNIAFEGGRIAAPEPLELAEPVAALASSCPEDGILVCASGRHLHTYDLKVNYPPSPCFIGEEIHSLAVSEDGTSAIVGLGSTFQKWDLLSGERQWSIAHQLHSTNYRPLALASGVDLAVVALDDHSVSLLDFSSGERLARLEHPQRHRVWDVAVTAGGTRVALLTAGHLVQIWKLDALARQLEDRGFTVSFPTRREE